MEAEKAVKYSSSRTFLLRSGQSGGSGHGRSPSGSAPPVWWGRWSAPDTGGSWQSAAPTCVVSSPASAEAQMRKRTWALVSAPFATLHIALRSWEQRHGNKHRHSTGILDRMCWILITKTASQRNPVKVCVINYISETANRRNLKKKPLCGSRIHRAVNVMRIITFKHFKYAKDEIPNMISS